MLFTKSNCFLIIITIAQSRMQSFVQLTTSEGKFCEFKSALGMNFLNVYLFRKGVFN